MVDSSKNRPRARASNVIRLPDRGVALDVRDALLNNQSAPKVERPKRVNDAIEAKARELAREAYELCQEHLQRRVAYCCEQGYPVRKLNVDKALRVIAEGDLADALATPYREKLKYMEYQAITASKMAEEFQRVAAEIQDALRAKPS